jgi:phosphatidylserine/phosphatidylglycerophosphate/cardiolipin synthase-like enzyme
MPWHDVAVQVRGNSVHDLARHFTNYWNFVNFQTRFDDRELLNLAGMHPSRRSSSAHRNNKIQPVVAQRKYTSDNEGEQVDTLVEEQYYQKYLDESVVRFMSL